MRAEELALRIAFTLGALVLYRIGTYIPLPGIDPANLSRILVSNLPNSGRASHGLAILGLGIMSYVTAAVIVQLFTFVFGIRERLDAGGQRGARIIERYTLVVTALFAIMQSLPIASGLEELPNLVSEPGRLFRISTVATLSGGTFFLIWLSRQITLHGVGNGLALILSVGIVAELPVSMAGALEYGRRGVAESNLVLMLSALLVVVTVLIVVIESARCRVPIEYAAWRVGAQSIDPRPSDLALKLNNAGIIPAVVTPWLLYIPLAFASHLGGQASWLRDFAEQLGSGQPAYMIYLALAIVIFALVYTAFILNPAEVAEKLKQYGGNIPGIEPGEPTAAYVDNVLSRTALLGAIYLAVICLIPEVLAAFGRANYGQVPFHFGGVPALIVVSTVLDIEQESQRQLQSA